MKKRKLSLNTPSFLLLLIYKIVFFSIIMNNVKIFVEKVFGNLWQLFSK